MSADPGSIHADSDQPLPNLTTGDVSTDPHIITAPARTGTDIELRIHTSIAPFDVAAEEWFPAAAGFAVTVIVHTVDAQTGAPRYLPPAEPAERARAIFSTVDSAHGYFLGAVDPGTGSHRRGQLAYRLYLDTDRQGIPVPRQVVTCPHYQLSAIDGRAEITIPTTA
ncbi:N-formylglutamate amidohydrolase [Rhodococcus opacus]|uniref:N-formylglutamate amidohydrolase n=1 Tax=Rhodococcus opacus TaxID=37919 RepID=UPI0024BB61CA|nr:N-formylglutamate amidohydrolase [Rhodococcus opacus]MDJ0418876.1 N-formylglutamate amidohydrolase [Rhodococcus opacus]